MNREEALDTYNYASGTYYRAVAVLDAAWADFVEVWTSVNKTGSRYEEAWVIIEEAERTFRRAKVTFKVEQIIFYKELAAFKETTVQPAKRQEYKEVGT